jgi:C-terminal processing protease CtpA/Prc
MHKSITRLWLAAGLVLAACGSPAPVPAPTRPPATAQAAATPTRTAAPAPTPAPTSAPADPGGPLSLSGSFTYTNDIITIYYYQHAVKLFDMHGFVTRDEDWELPVESQVIGHLALDEEARLGEFSLRLPARPAGQPSDVNGDGNTQAGIQVFAVAYSPNLTGGPFSEGDDRSTGWPSYLASVRTDNAREREVVGGRLVVWAPEAGHEFPTGFGPDGLLFTDDDPLGPLPSGYSVIDLDESPFGVLRQAEVELTLYEPLDAALKDYADLSYTEAFDLLYEKASIEWAFNGIPSKFVDWPALYDQIAPLVAQAERDRDPHAFFKALQAFSWAIPDGHVGLDGGDLFIRDFSAHVSAGYGFAIRELDDGRALVVYVTRGGPADQAGMLRGAELLDFNGLPAAEAISQVMPYAGPFSLESSRRYQQMRYLLRAPAGTRAEVRFANPGQPPQAATLQAVNERDSFAYTSIYRATDPLALPVDSRLLDSGIGYIKLNTNYDDLALILRLFERALKTLDEAGVSRLILDLRENPGGAPLGLAGFFTDQEITLGQLEYYSEHTGQFEPRGKPRRILPNERQFGFTRLAVLVGQACASACELEAYGFSQLPHAQVVGMYPTAGIEAEVLRGQFKLPEGMGFQLPTGRFVNPDGSLFLEGEGVLPDVRVPLTEETLLADDDVELLAAEDALLGVGAPGGSLRLPGGPVLLSASASREAIGGSGLSFLEDAAIEDYGPGVLPQAGQTFTYTIDLTSDQRLVWLNGWCASSQALLRDNIQKIQVEFLHDGQPVSSRQFASFEGLLGQQFCQLFYTVAYRWPAGTTRLDTRLTLQEVIFDGLADHPAGTLSYVYLITRR